MREHDRRARSKATEVKREGFRSLFPCVPSSPFPLKCHQRRLWLSRQTQTRTQSLLCMHCDWWEGFSELALQEGKEGMKNEKRRHFSSLLPKRLCARQIAFPYSFARINKWRLGTSLLRRNFPFRKQVKRAEQNHARSSREASPKSGRTRLQTSYHSK